MTGPLLNRPIGKSDSKAQLSQDSFLDETFRGTYTGDNLILKGFAKPGASEGSLVWQIAQLAYDGAGNVLSIKWPLNAQGVASSDYEFSWTIATTTGYTYV